MEMQVWGWQPALYLFLGGLGAAAFVVAGVMVLKNFETYRKTAGVAMVFSVGCLAVGLALLLSELTAPLRGLMMWQSFSNFSSWMTIGAWLLFAAIVVFAAGAFVTLDATARLVFKGENAQTARASLAKGLGAVGIVLGFGVAVYTGILLMEAPGVPLWNTLLLPALFTVSALDTGVALVELISARTLRGAAVAQKTASVMSLCSVALIVIESLVLLILSQTMLSGGAVTAVSTGSELAAAQDSMAAILTGSLAPWFWVCVVVIGLALPLIASLVNVAVRSAAGEIAARVGAAGVLVGGCVLRFVVLYAGFHANVLADAVSGLVFF